MITKAEALNAHVNAAPTSLFRNLLLHPFTSDSAFNMPIGEDATMVDADLTSLGIRMEENIINMDHTFSNMSVYDGPCGWASQCNRCKGHGTELLPYLDTDATTISGTSGIYFDGTEVYYLYANTGDGASKSLSYPDNKIKMTCTGTGDSTYDLQFYSRTNNYASVSTGTKYIFGIVVEVNKACDILFVVRDGTGSHIGLYETFSFPEAGEYIIGHDFTSTATITTTGIQLAFGNNGDNLEVTVSEMSLAEVDELSTLTDVPMDPNFTTQLIDTTRKENNSAALIMDDGETIFEGQPLDVCQSGGYMQCAYPKTWSGSLTGDGRYSGSHGGAGLTALGGCIRYGEFTAGEINHTLQLVVPGQALYWDGTGYTWPARNADSYASTGYTGSNTSMLMGSLLCLDWSFNINSLLTTPGKIIATTFKKYGGYIVDTTGSGPSSWEMFYIGTERGPAGRVIDEFENLYSTPFQNLDHAGAPTNWSTDMQTIITALKVITNNSAEFPGGPGAKRASLTARGRIITS